MGELGALFNPGMRHELEERQAKAARREEEGNARDGDLRIDLDSGVAVINIQDEDDDESTASGGPAESPAGRAAPAAPDASVVPGGTEVERFESEQSAEGAKSAAPALRPRGKRGMSTSPR